MRIGFDVADLVAPANREEERTGRLSWKTKWAAGRFGRRVSQAWRTHILYRAATRVSKILQSPKLP